jgi:hypothetical protein
MPRHLNYGGAATQDTMTCQRSKGGKPQRIRGRHMCNTWIEGPTGTQSYLNSPCTPQTAIRAHKAVTQPKERAGGPTRGSDELGFGRTASGSSSPLLARVNLSFLPKAVKCAPGAPRMQSRVPTSPKIRGEGSHFKDTHNLVHFLPF